MRDFIITRLNKDNFWNLMFLVLPSLIILITQLLMDFIFAGFLLLFAAIIFAPYFIAKLNITKYQNNNFISSSTNRNFGNNIPKHLGFLLWCSIPFTVFWVLLLHKKAPYLNENIALYNLIFWFAPTMCFI